MEIRTLRADEVEARVQTVKETGCSILLYKDARCDMRILDEVFGVTGWQRTHEVINGNMFCNVSIWDAEKEQWIVKQDVGTESYTEKEKGQASDSFKRACFNLGIGRELYTGPFIWVRLEASETYKGSNGKLGVKTRFTVSQINYNDNKEIIGLEIKDDKGNVRYSLVAPQKVTTTQVKALKALANRKGSEIKAIEDYYGFKIEDMDTKIYTHAVNALEKKEDK